MHSAIAQPQEDFPSPSELKKLSIEELMGIEVTSVSRYPEKLSETASAIQIITQEDIHRFGATRLPEALRLASNLQIAQIDQAQWSISARGFNAPLANKLLVLIDGRAVYSPLFAGVFWDIQDVFLEDVERIEVISGPGGTLWGANAVNGVINIITKSAKDTQGVLLEGGGGTELHGYGGARYGGSIASDLHFRVYGKYSSRDGMVLSDGQDVDDNWHMGQGGFRLDWEASDANLLTLQGDLYKSRVPVAGASDRITNGGNVIGRWTHTISEASDFELQLYFDQVHRNFPGSYDDVLNTYDMDFQHRFPIGERNKIVWGAGYRLAEDDFGPGTVALVPRRLSLQTFSLFAQDEIALKKDKLHLTLGTKVQHNNYTGFEFQPNVRMSWKLREQQTLWAAVSRAVRMPSRLDRDLIIPPNYAGGPDFVSEELLAYELGYRIQPHERLALSLATFYHDYDEIRSVEQANPPMPTPLVIGNEQEGESYGAELTAHYQVMDTWRLRAGYTALQVDIRSKLGSTDNTSGANEAADSEHYFSLRSSLELPGNFEFAPMFRYVSRVTNPIVPVPGYSELDVRLAWRPMPKLELSVLGQNLLHDRHPEFGDPATRQEVERSIYGKILWKF